LTKAKDYQDLVVAYRNGAAVRLHDVASVTDSIQDIYSGFTFYNTITNTWSILYINNDSSTKLSLSSFYGIYNFKLYCMSYGYKYVYDYQSETLTNNTLALLSGSTYIVKLITTSNINYFKTFFQEAWWYDTTFEEYPTYIGDGTSWTKIKN
jgi:hypothetical protein